MFCAKAQFHFLYLVILGALLVAQTARAAIEIPTGLGKSDRQEALRIIGFGTSGKILSDPYPMGGYAGFELGFAAQELPTDDLGRLGNHVANPQDDSTYPQLSLAKGLYNNIDIFIHFTPYTQQTEMSQYGGIVRWGFYQAKFLPMSAALLLHLNSTDISNVLATRTYGFDINGGINVDQIALYIGAGYLQAAGTFNSTITDSGLIENEIVNGVHTFVGANIKLPFEDMFIALQMDRYTITVFSAKVGVRF